MAQPDSIRYPIDLVHLWLHESSRVYSDKLMEEKDEELFNKILLDTGKRYFEVNAGSLSAGKHPSCTVRVRRQYTAVSISLHTGLQMLRIRAS